MILARGRDRDLVTNSSIKEAGIFGEPKGSMRLLDGENLNVSSPSHVFAHLKVALTSPPLLEATFRFGVVFFPHLPGRYHSTSPVGQSIR